MDVSIPYTFASRLPSRCLAGVLAILIAAGPVGGYASQDPGAATTAPSHSTKKAAASKTAGKKTVSSKTRKNGRAKASRRRIAHRGTKAQRRARTARLKQAFVASSELRPMAQQLILLRTPAAYSGVTNYAHHHSGDAAAAAYLALGRAYLLDKRYAEASANLRESRQASEILADYCDFLAAEAEHNAGNETAALALLKGFNDRHPDSIFDLEAPELEANVLLATGDTAGAQKVLATIADDAADLPNYELTEAKIANAQQQMAESEKIFKHLLLVHPLSPEASVARARLAAMGAENTLTPTELRSLGDAYYNAGRYAEASEQYHALAAEASLDPTARNGFAVAAAACELKLKRLTQAEAERLADTQDENGARRQYLLMELARNRNDEAEQQRIVTLMETNFPQSPWLAEALYSSANMYMLRRDYPTAITYYSYLATHFPSHKNAAAAHWRAGWLSYRQGLFNDASRLFDEQIKQYPTATETAAALYWRGRLFETLDHNQALAIANYHSVTRTYQHYFYAQMARSRLAALGDTQLISQPVANEGHTIPQLADAFPEDSPHLAKARLLANAGLNDYIGQEIAADPDSTSWSALAEAQIYASFGETYRAMRALKKAMPYATSASIQSVPLVYWRILFPEAWWDTIKSESAKNGLDPYLVASLIRQESEFNPSAISYANAYGLMQLEPSVGKSLAREEGMSHFETFQLLDPITNIRLGTKYLRQMVDRFGGVQEYALAAYNAGESRVVDWQAAGPYGEIDEFVESIPFTQTRDYVQGILRNEDIYRSIDAAATMQGHTGVGASK
jgi:soluble lytic murein transglycosylase